MICGCPSRGNGDSHGADLAPLRAPSPPRPPQRDTPRSSGQGLTRSAHAATDHHGPFYSTHVCKRSPPRAASDPSHGFCSRASRASVPAAKDPGEGSFLGFCLGEAGLPGQRFPRRGQREQEMPGGLTMKRCLCQQLPISVRFTMFSQILLI